MKKTTLPHISSARMQPIMIMNKVLNVPNIITLTRPLLTIGCLYYVLHNEYLIALTFIIFICITDICDGAIARHLKMTSRLGSYLDVFADLFYVISTLICLNIRGVAPVWFTAVVIVEFGEFLLTSMVLNKKSIDKKLWVFDVMGKSFATIVFISPGLFCLTALLPDMSIMIIFFTLTASCMVAVVSCTQRIVRCIKQRKEKMVHEKKWTL